MQRRDAVPDPYPRLEGLLTKFADSALPRGEFVEYRKGQDEAIKHLTASIDRLNEQLDRLTQNAPSRREHDELHAELRDLKQRFDTLQTSTTQQVVTAQTGAVQAKLFTSENVGRLKDLLLGAALSACLWLALRAFGQP